jgi:E3 ubiquitin-protein ligase HERC2
LEILLTGSPEMDVSLLQSKTEYRGNVCASDKHVLLFWEVLHDLTQEQRASFLQFVWGRRNLPSNALGFGKDLFKLSDHAAALQNGGHDQYLPVAHTCFFALELPRYSSKAVLSSKLLYAISNCSVIDGDATHEGRANMMMTWDEDEDD